MHRHVIRNIWIIVIVFTHWVGSLIYIFVRRPQRIQQYGR